MALVAAIGLSSCGNEFDGMDVYEPSKERAVYDGSHAMMCAKGQKTISYRLVSAKEYTMDDLTKGKWVYLGIMDGGSLLAPESLCFSKGSLYTPLVLFKSYCGPTMFSAFLSKYCRAIGRSLSVFIRRDYDIDMSSGRMRIGAGEFDFVGMNQDGMVLTYESVYTGGRTQNGGKNLEVSHYELADIDISDDSRILRFDSVGEAYQWLIDVCTDTFGESIDMNEGQNDVIYDHGVINISYLEDEMRQREKTGDMF